MLSSSSKELVSKPNPVPAITSSVKEPNVLQAKQGNVKKTVFSKQRLMVMMMMMMMMMMM